MMAWLHRGASRYAERVFEVDHHLRFGQGPVRGPFGLVRPELGYFPARTLRCLSGEREDCGGIIMDPRVQASFLGRATLDLLDLLSESPVDFVEGRPRFGGETRDLEPYLFFAMEEEFGRDRFGRFWTSALPPEAAFQEAFGEPFDLWIMKWFRQYFESPPRGPGVPVHATFLTLLSLGILAGFGVRMGRR